MHTEHPPTCPFKSFIHSTHYMQKWQSLPFHRFLFLSSESCASSLQTHPMRCTTLSICFRFGALDHPLISAARSDHLVVHYTHTYHASSFISFYIQVDILFFSIDSSPQPIPYTYIPSDPFLQFIKAAPPAAPSPPQRWHPAAPASTAPSTPRRRWWGGWAARCRSWERWAGGCTRKARG